MKKLFITLFVLAQLALTAQEVQVATKAFTYTTEIAAIGKGAKTTNWVTIKGVKCDLYQGAKGGHYYITKDKDGNFVRKYVKI